MKQHPPSGALFGALVFSQEEAGTSLLSCTMVSNQEKAGASSRAHALIFSQEKTGSSLLSCRPVVTQPGKFLGKLKCACSAHLSRALIFSQEKGFGQTKLCPQQPAAPPYFFFKP